MKAIMRLAFFIVLSTGAAQMGFSRGDKIIPQVVDGPGWATKFDLTNISTSADYAIENMYLVFYHNDGTRWSVPTNLGTGSEFRLNLAARETKRVETLGGSTMGAGYAVIYDEEPYNSGYSEDYVLGISVFYVASTPAGIVDTVTVSVPQPTALATLPVQMDDSAGIYSGISIANWYGTNNTVTIKLYNANGSICGETSFTLADGVQRAEFLDQTLFPGLRTFKGMAEITSQGPVALLGLLQTRSVSGSQYSTLIPVDKESLRRNSYTVVLQAYDDERPYMPLDVDSFIVDYGRNEQNTESYPWDFVYRYDPENYTTRYLEPWNHSMLAYLGELDDFDFDAVSIMDLRSASYSSSNLNLSGSNLRLNYTFAIYTDIGNYAKARIVRIIESNVEGRDYRDLVLEVCVYK